MTYELYLEEKLPKGWCKKVLGHMETWATIYSTGNRGTYVKRSSEYGSWYNMLHRCYTHSHPENSKHYLDKGIRVCSRWVIGDGTKCGFLCFLEDMGLRPEGTTLGRHGDIGHYIPGNVSWQTPAEQGETRSRKRAS